MRGTFGPRLKAVGLGWGLSGDEMDPFPAEQREKHRSKARGGSAGTWGRRKFERLDTNVIRESVGSRGNSVRPACSLLQVT
jgi:hypothetical protein